MARSQPCQRPRRATSVRAPKVRHLLDKLEERTLPSSEEWLVVFGGLSPADNLADQAQAGQNLLSTRFINKSLVFVITSS